MGKPNYNFSLFLFCELQVVWPILTFDTCSGNVGLVLPLWLDDLFVQEFVRIIVGDLSCRDESNTFCISNLLHQAVLGPELAFAVCDFSYTKMHWTTKDRGRLCGCRATLRGQVRSFLCRSNSTAEVV